MHWGIVQLLRIVFLVTLVASIHGDAAGSNQALFKANMDDWPNAQVFTSSGKSIAAAVRGDIHVYSLPGGEVVGSVEGHGNYVQALAYNAATNWLYSAGWDGALLKWQLDDRGAPVMPPAGRAVLGTKRPRSICVSNDGRFIFVNGKGNLLDVYNAESMEKAASLSGLKDTATCMAHHPTRSWILAGDKRGILAIWDLESMTLVKSWNSRGKAATGLIVDPGNGEFLSADSEGKLQRWDPTSFKKIQSIDMGESIHALQASPDGRFYYVALKSGRIEILNRESTRLEESLELSGRPLGLALDGSGRFLAMGSDKNQLRVWDLLEIRDIRIAYEIPAKLDLEVDFDDAASLIPNRALDGGERANLICKVRNTGDGNAYDVTLIISCENDDISHDERLELGDILSGEGKSVRIPVDVDLHAGDGTATFDFHATEKKLNDTRGSLRLTVWHLPMPSLSIETLTLDDSGIGNTVGNGNGIPENDEVVEVEVFVRNEGRGSTWDTALMLTHQTPGVSVRTGEVALPVIPPGGSSSGRIQLVVPKTFAVPSLELGIKVVDAVTGVVAEANHAWQTRHNVPVLAGGLRALRSLRNGDSANLELVLENTGNLAAEQISIEISNDAGLSIYPEQASIAKLVAGAKDPGKYFDVTLPPEFDLDRVQVSATIRQADFSGTTVSAEFPVQLRKPRLALVGIPEELQVVRGQDLVLDLSVVNRGDLAAEDVTVHVNAPDLGLNREIPVGRIQEQGSVSLDRIPLAVPSGKETGSILVTVEATQRFFQPLRKICRPEIVSEEIRVTEIESTGPAGGLIPSATGLDTGHDHSSDGTFSVEFFDFKAKVHSPSYNLEILARAPQRIRGLRAWLNGEMQYNLQTETLDQSKLRRANDLVLNTVISLNHLRSDRVNRLRVVLEGEDRATREYEQEIVFEELDFDIVDGLDPNVDVNKPPRTALRNQDAVALLVGISRYRNRGCSIPPVEFAAQDVGAVKQTLIRTLGYREENIIVLLDEDATKNDIELALKVDLPEMIKPETSDLLIYFCGHGAPGPDKKSGYIIPYNGNPAENRIQLTSYALDEFYAAVRRIPAREVTIAIDACFSGEFDGGTLIPDISPVGVSVEGVTGGKENWLVYSASGKSEFSSWYREKKHGLFTYFFLKGLQGAAGDEEILAGELDDYLRENVARVAKKRGLNQSPQFHGRRDIVIVDPD